MSEFEIRFLIPILNSHNNYCNNLNILLKFKQNANTAINPLPGGPLAPLSPAALGAIGPSRMDDIRRANTISMTLIRLGPPIEGCCSSTIFAPPIEKVTVYTYADYNRRHSC